MPTWSRPTYGHEYSPDEYNNIMYDLRFEACENSEECIHSDTPYGPGTNYHYDTCPRAEENQ